MELKINEINHDYDVDNFEFNTDIQNVFSTEEIPENKIPIKVIKKGVHFDETNIKPIKQSIPKQYSKMVRPNVPSQKPKISYEDILSKMGMLVSDGKLHLIDRNKINFSQNEQKVNTNTILPNNNPNLTQSQNQNYNIPKNNYIYNKYFKDEIKPENNIRRPQNINEYKLMVLEDLIKRQRIKQMKSTKLIMPNPNINISSRSSGNLNKLFNFSKR